MGIVSVSKMMNLRLREGQSPKFPQVERERPRLEPCLPSISSTLFHKPEIIKVWEPHQVLHSLPFFNLTALSFSPWALDANPSAGGEPQASPTNRTRTDWAARVT